MNKRQILKGDIVYTQSASKFESNPDSYLLIEDGLSCGVYDSIPDGWKNVPITDYSGCLIVPGFIDLHAHAPQYSFCGIGMDCQLLDWLKSYTFPIESKYKNLEYAEKMYLFFVNKLTRSATTRAVLFGTIHTDSNILLAKLLEKSGLKILLGKVNMNRNSIPDLCETTETSLSETERFIIELQNFKNVKPIITPRFVPSCSIELMQGLSFLAKKYSLPIQSHLDENLGEIALVKELHPECSSYTDVYRKYGLLNERTVMAHCVHLTDDEQKIFKESGSVMAHCALSNTNLLSGVAPTVHYLESGQRIGLGTDYAGGSSISMFRAASDTIRASKLRFYYTNQDRPVKVSEAFYMATKGGGAFFGKVGSFEKDYEFDALVIDDSSLGAEKDFSLSQRIERVLYLSSSFTIKAKYVCGNLIQKPKSISS